MDAAVTVKAPVGAQGKRIDVFLAEAEIMGGRAEAQRALESERVTVDGAKVRKSHRLSGGETISVSAVELSETHRDEPTPVIKVLFEDDLVAVIDKPAGLVVHPGAGHQAGTLLDALLERFGPYAGEFSANAWRAGLVHRLDKETSGALIVAKTPDSAESLKAMMRRRLIEREYMAVVEGDLESRTGTIDAALGRDPYVPTRFAIVGSGRPARTHFTVVERLAKHTLVSVRLETGRTHQIRVHFAAIGHPVSGDGRYGGTDSFGLGRHFLHACKIRFPHPALGEPMTVICDPPDALAQALVRAAAR